MSAIDVVAAAAPVIRGRPGGWRRRRADSVRLRTLYRAMAGNLSRASRFLDRARQEEARLAFLACRAIDAFEDLAPAGTPAIDGIRAALAFLLGQAGSAPDSASLRHAQGHDGLERELAAMLVELRGSLDALPASSRMRIHRLLRDVAGGMIDAAANGLRGRIRYYGAAVLGPVGSYIFDLLGLGELGAADAASMGAVVQAANDLRDLADDDKAEWAQRAGDRAERELILYLTVAEFAPRVLVTLRTVTFSARSRERAAVAYLILTTSAFFMKRLGIVLSPPFTWPRAVAILAMTTSRGYEYVLAEVEQALLRCIHAACLRFGGEVPDWAHDELRSCRRRRQAALERRIAASHPDRDAGRALAYASDLVHIALVLARGLPDVPLTRMSYAGRSARFLMVSDYLLACAIGVMSGLGNDCLLEVGRSTAALARTAAEDGTADDSRGEIAGLLTRIVGRSLGMQRSARERCARRNRALAVRLRAMDQASWWRRLARYSRLLRIQARSATPRKTQLG